MSPSIHYVQRSILQILQQSISSVIGAVPRLIMILQPIYEVVFQSDTSVATAFYDTISYNSVLTLNDDLDIPAGAEYNFGSSFRFDVEDGATLRFNGTADNPISLLPADSLGWGGIRLSDSSNVLLAYTKLIDADIGLDIQECADTLLNNVFNNTFGFCETAIMIRHRDFYDWEISHNIFH